MEIPSKKKGSALIDLFMEKTSTLLGMRFLL
jgi:hypothetical protein